MYTREEILSAIRGTVHVNAYTEKKREEILSKPYFEEALAELKRRSDKAIATVLPHQDFSLFKLFETVGSRKEFGHAFMSARHKFVYNVLAAWLFDDKDALTAAEDTLWLILNEYSWSPPAHISVGTSEENKRAASLEVIMCDDTYVVDLQSAETAATVAEALLILGDKLHPFVVKRARFELERRVFKPFLTRLFIWNKKRNNWASVCASNVCIAALSVIEDEERLADILFKAFGSLEHYLSGFSSDGACLEGLGYWNYGFGPYVNLAKLLLDRTGGKINLFDFPIVEKVARFYSKCFFAGKKTVSFADGYTTAEFVPATHSVLLSQYPDLEVPDEFKTFALVEDSRLCDAARFFIQTTEKYVNASGKSFGTHILPLAEWFVSSSQNGVGIAAKGGHNGEPHNHNDVGNFLIYKNGREIISDLGCGEYTKSYFNEHRYENFAPSSRSHSLPIINGEYQKNGAEYRATNTVITKDGISTDISTAYCIEMLSALKRSISFDTVTGDTQISDIYEFKSTPTSVTERLVTLGTARIDEDNVVIENDGEKMLVKFDNTLLNVKITVIDDTDRHGLPRKTTVIDFEVVSPTENFAVDILITSEREKQ